MFQRIWGRIEYDDEWYLVTTFFRGGDDCEESFRIYRERDDHRINPESMPDVVAEAAELLHIKYDLSPVRPIRLHSHDIVDVVVKRVIPHEKVDYFVVIAAKDHATPVGTLIDHTLATMVDGELTECSDPLVTAPVWALYEAEIQEEDAAENPGSVAPSNDYC